MPYFTGKLIFLTYIIRFHIWSLCNDYWSILTFYYCVNKCKYVNIFLTLDEASTVSVMRLKAEDVADPSDVHVYETITMDRLMPERNSKLPVFASLLTFFNNFSTFGKNWINVAWESLNAFWGRCCTLVYEGWPSVSQQIRMLWTLECYKTWLRRWPVRSCYSIVIRSLKYFSEKSNRFK